jgi:hypothetical protein
MLLPTAIAAEAPLITDASIRAYTQNERLPRPSVCQPLYTKSYLLDVGDAAHRGAPYRTVTRAIRCSPLL